MPQKALVAFGVALACALPVSTTAGAAPKTDETKTVESTAILPVLSRDEVMKRVLAQNPKLSAFDREVRARQFEADQSGLRPNPELAVEVENIAGSGDFSGTASAETTVRLSQRFELGGKRLKRRELARAKREAAGRTYETVRAEVLSRAADRFVAVLAARKRLSLAGEQADLAARVMQTVEERIAAGKTAAIEKVRLRPMLVEARLRQEKARKKLKATRQALAGTWGSEEVDFAAVQGFFETIAGVPEFSDLTAALSRSPEAALQQSLSRQAGRTVVLEKAEGIPDMTLSLGAKNDRGSGDNALVAEVSMPLPIFDRNQGAVAAARARKAKAEDAQRSAKVRLRTALAEGWQELNAAYSEVTVLREEILPATREAFEAVVYGYRAGKFGSLEVLDAERSLFEARSRYVDALTSYHQTISELERLLGKKIFSDDEYFAPSEEKRGQT